MLSAILALLLNPQADTLRYRLIDLGPYNRDRVGGRKVNSLGWITSARQWVWRPDGGWFELPVWPGFQRTDAVDINEKCEIAVRLQNVGPDLPAVWSPTTGLKVIEMPPGLRFHTISAINNNGEIVGFGFLPGGDVLHGWLSIPGQPTIDLGESPDGVGSKCADINDAGVIAAEHIGPDGLNALHFWHRDGSYKYVGHPQGYDFFPKAINEKGQVVGFGSALSSYQTWSPQSNWARLDGVFQTSGAYGSNNLGWIVGSGSYNGVYQGFLWRPGFGALPFKSLVDSSGDGWHFAFAYSVSDNGYITGLGWTEDQDHPRCFLAVPVIKKNNKG